MLTDKKGAALMQVLLVTAVLAGMATMLLRASLSRTTSARQTRQAISTELLIESCQAEINMMWSNKTPEAFARDLSGCWMNCNLSVADDLSYPAALSSCKAEGDVQNETTASPSPTPVNATRSYTCKVPVPGGTTVDVVASFVKPDPAKKEDPCKLEYTISRDNIDPL